MKFSFKLYVYLEIAFLLIMVSANFVTTIVHQIGLGVTGVIGMIVTMAIYEHLYAKPKIKPNSVLVFGAGETDLSDITKLTIKEVDDAIVVYRVFFKQIETLEIHTGWPTGWKLIDYIVMRTAAWPKQKPGLRRVIIHQENPNSAQLMMDRFNREKSRGHFAKVKVEFSKPQGEDRA